MVLTLKYRQQRKLGLLIHIPLKLWDVSLMKPLLFSLKQASFTRQRMRGTVFSIGTCPMPMENYTMAVKTEEDKFLSTHQVNLKDRQEKKMHLENWNSLSSLTILKPFKIVIT